MLVNLSDVLPQAQAEHYAVGLFNTTDTDMLEAVLAAAEELRAPVIIGTAEILLPYGELRLIAPALTAAAARARVPVVVHYDHGLTFGRCMEALKCGFSSIMFDGSGSDPACNIAGTREIVRVAHAMGATVEGELGCVGQAETGDETRADQYTDPEEAAAFVESTGVDALAVAVGTAHGAYRAKPRIDINRLRAIRAAVDTPLVLHGGSGLSDNDFRDTIREGIAKVNIFTDLCAAGERAMAACSTAGADYLKTRSEKVDAIRKAVKEKICLFGSAGKG